MHSDMFHNDSLNFESEAKETYRKLLEVFADEGISQRKLAELIEIKATTLRKYRREGTVSLYTTKRLSNLLGLNRDYFNGKTPITQEVEQEVREAIRTKLSGREVSLEKETPTVVESNFQNDNLLDILKSKTSSPYSYDDYNLEDLNMLVELLEKSLVIAKAKVQILQVTTNRTGGE